MSLKDNQVHLLFFTAVWCPPCQRMKPLVEKIIKQFPQIELRKIDCDVETNMATQFNIKSLPTLVLVNNYENPSDKAQELSRMVGSTNEEDFTQWILKSLNI